MTTKKKEIINLQKSRGQILSSIKGIQGLEKSAKQRQQELFPIVLGTGDKRGIVHFLYFFARLDELINSFITLTPDFRRNFINQYRTHLFESLNKKGDGVHGFYPPVEQNGEQVASKEFNEENYWVQNFSKQFDDSAYSLVSCINRLEYLSTSGSIESIKNEAARLSTLSITLRDTVKNLLDTIYDPWELVKEFYEFDITEPVGKLYGEVFSFKLLMNNRVQYLNKFTDLAQVRQQSKLLAELVQTCRTVIALKFKPVYAAIEQIKPTLNFWLQEIVKKDQGCISMEQALPAARNSLMEKLYQAEQRLTVLLPNRNDWLESPTIQNFAEKQFRNKSHLLQELEVSISWSPVLYANKYKIYKKNLEDITDLSNDDWGDSLIGEVDTLNENGFLNNFFTKTFTEDFFEPWVFRVEALDTSDSSIPRAGEFNTKSKQSDIFGKECDIQSINGTTIVADITLEVDDRVFIGNEICTVDLITDEGYELDRIPNGLSVRKILGLFKGY